MKEVYMQAIKKFLKPIIVFFFNLYFHSDEKSIAFVRKILRKENIDRCFISPQELETILATQVQDEYDFSQAKAAKKLVVFFEITPYRICGGQMSIFSLCKYSKEILHDDTAVLMSTIPGKYTYSHNNFFENNIDVCRWEQIRELLKEKQHVILHIPEVDIIHPETGEEVMYNALRDDFELLKSIPDLHINIMHQNIELMPPREKFSWLYSLTDNITITVGHKASATQQVCDDLAAPMHLWPAYYDLGKLKKIPLQKKEKLILLSADLQRTTLNSKIEFIKKINTAGYRVFIILNLKFQDFMRLSAAATAVVTFGEGFDGYLNNPPQTGTLSFAVYNDEFFPSKKWKTLPNIYSSYDEMMEHFVDDIQEFTTNEALYTDTISTHVKWLDELYNKNEYINRLRLFYKKAYDFYPNLKKRKN